MLETCSQLLVYILRLGELHGAYRNMTNEQQGETACTASAMVGLVRGVVGTTGNAWQEVHTGRAITTHQRYLFQGSAF